MKLITKYIIATSSLILSSVASSTVIDTTSPSGFDVTTVGVTSIGGIVTDLVGLNGNHVVSQVAASSLHRGYSNTNPFVIGVQNGFDSTVTDSLGGGLVSASFRFTLYDGDTALSNFDYTDNDLLVNGINFGDWSAVDAINTDSMGNITSKGSSGGGFRNNSLDTGWFSSIDTVTLGSLYANIISTNTITFQLDDKAGVGDNYFDFTQGVDSSLIDVGQGPVIGGDIPEPSMLAIFALGLMGLVSRKLKQ